MPSTFLSWVFAQLFPLPRWLFFLVCAQLDSSHPWERKWGLFHIPNVPLLTNFAHANFSSLRILATLFALFVSVLLCIPPPDRDWDRDLGADGLFGRRGQKAVVKTQGQWGREGAKACMFTASLPGNSIPGQKLRSHKRGGQKEGKKEKSGKFK